LDKNEDRLSNSGVHIDHIELFQTGTLADKDDFIEWYRKNFKARSNLSEATSLNKKLRLPQTNDCSQLKKLKIALNERLEKSSSEEPDFGRRRNNSDRPSPELVCDDKSGNFKHVFRIIDGTIDWDPYSPANDDDGVIKFKSWKEHSDDIDPVKVVASVDEDCPLQLVVTDHLKICLPGNKPENPRKEFKGYVEQLKLPGLRTKKGQSLGLTCKATPRFYNISAVKTALAKLANHADRVSYNDPSEIFSNSESSSDENLIDGNDLELNTPESNDPDGDLNYNDPLEPQFT
jgi:hypothetical protein